MTELRYYRRKSDQAVFAIVTHGGRPERAAGPVADWQNTDPTELGDRAVDASGWDLSEFEPAGGLVFQGVRGPGTVHGLSAAARASGHFDTRPPGGPEKN